MKVTINPKDEIREMLPVEIYLREVQGEPTLKVDLLGDIFLQKQGNEYKANVWFPQKGDYQYTVLDSSGSSFQGLIQVHGQSYMNFTEEFLLFSSLLLLAFLGGFWWKKKKKS